MASLRMDQSKRDGTIWRVLFRHDGKQCSKTFPDQRLATKFKGWIEALGPAEALAILAEHQGLSSDNEVTTLHKFATEHIASLSGITEGTRDRYTAMLAGPLKPLAERPIESITPKAVRGWVNAQDGTVSGKTLANRHGLLSALMKAAVADGVIPSNPCVGTRLPKTEQSEMCFLTGQEFATFLAHVRPDAQDIVSAMPATGLRLGEITALQVRDLDLDRRTLTVSRAWKYAEKGPATLGAPKSKKSRRTIGIPAALIPVLREAIEGRKADDYVFTNSRGTHWTRSRFHEGVWQPAAKAAQKDIGKKPRPHDMRHTCASWMIAAGVSLPVLQRHLGHENISVTIDRYGHLQPAHLQEAAKALDAEIVFALPQIEG